MKRSVVLVPVLLFSVALGFAEPTDAASSAPTAPAASPAPALAAAAPSAAPASSSMASYESPHYLISSELGQDRAQALGAEFEALFGLFGGTFRFESSALPGKLKVKEFKDKAGFDSYLQNAAGQTKDDFVYLHYSLPERRELLLFSKEGSDAGQSLVHQAFVQYLKAFVSNPPLWMRDGFAVYFESAAWDPKAKTLSLPENLAWLPTAKALLAKNAFLPVNQLLSLTPEKSRSQLDVVYPESWAFASFLLNSGDKAYNRLLWDSISCLRRDAKLEENQAAIADRAASWYVEADAQAAFSSYLSGRKTFADLVGEGVKSYGDKAYDAARVSFEAAAKQDEASYLPPYYLGLIAYAAGDYSLAEFNYKSALEKGCESAVANYALGLNAYAQKKTEDAKKYLASAKASSPERYGQKVDELLKKMGN
jgi:hypothetical protein